MGFQVWPYIKIAKLIRQKLPLFLASLLLLFSLLTFPQTVLAAATPLVASRVPPSKLSITDIPVLIRLEFLEDFTGTIEDTVPFEISVKQPLSGTPFRDQTVNRNLKKITWDISGKKGDTFELAYLIDSSAAVSLGPLLAVSSSGDSTLLESNSYSLSPPSSTSLTLPAIQSTLSVTRHPLSLVGPQQMASFTVLAQKDFSGVINEPIPPSYEVSPVSDYLPYDNISVSLNAKTLSWYLNLKKGETVKLAYQFSLPSKTSLKNPSFGPLVAKDNNGINAFSETSVTRLTQSSVSLVSKILSRLDYLWRWLVSYLRPANINLSHSTYKYNENIEIGLKNTDPGRLRVTLLSEGLEVPADQQFSRDSVIIEKPRSFRPGKYQVHVTDGYRLDFTQDFTWGVLAVNTDKSIYLQNENADISLAVLDDFGAMVCDAELELKITTPDGKTAVLSTIDGSIIVNPECQVHNYTEKPDYQTSYRVAGTGNYRLDLTAKTRRGTYQISDAFEVRDSVVFDLSRTLATRIFPTKPYPVRLSLLANRDFIGTIEESVPLSFEIKPIQGSRSYTSLSKQGSDLKISWNVSLKKGEKFDFGYTFDAPDISPEFYLLGPIRFIEAGGQELFRETRQWQIASDAVAKMLLYWDGTSSNIPDGWSCVSCNSGDFFYQRFARGAAVFSAAAGGTETHVHTDPGTLTSGAVDVGTTIRGSASTSSSSARQSDHTHTATLASGLSGTNLPAYIDLLVIQYDAGIPQTIPAGAIGLFDASPPANWNSVYGNNQYIRGSGTTQTTIQSSNTHTHPIVLSATSIYNVGTTRRSHATSTRYVAGVGHTHPSGSATSSSGNHEPPRIGSVLGKNNQVASLPSGLIAMFTDSPPSSTWSYLSDTSGKPYYQRFAKITGTYNSESSDNNTHSHTASVTTGSVTFPNTRMGTSNTYSFGTTTHTHTFSVSLANVASQLPPYTDVVIAKAGSTPAPDLQQIHYHWRADTGSEVTAPSETSGSEDTNPGSSDGGTNHRLRIEVSNEGSAAFAGAQFRLEYGTKSTTCAAISQGSWVDVGAAGGDWDMYNSANITNGSDTTNLAVGMSGGVTDANPTFISANSALLDTSSVSSALTLSYEDFVELEYSIKANISSGSYCFRVTNVGSTANFTYTRYPEAVVSGSGISLSGTCKQSDLSTNCTDTGTVRVAYNGTLQAQTQATVAGSWTISGLPAPEQNDIITVYIEGADDAKEAVAVTKYDGSGNITNIQLIENMLSIGSTDNPTISNQDLNAYDYTSSTNNEDIFYEVNGSTWALNACTDSSGTCTGNGIYVKNATYRPSSTGSVDIVTHDFMPRGVLTMDANNFYVSGDWNTSDEGSYTANTSSVYFNGAGYTTQRLVGSLTFYNLTITATESRTFEVQSNHSFYVIHNVNLSGADCQNPLLIRSSSPGTQYQYYTGANGEITRQYLDIQDMQGVNGTISFTSSVDSGNNTNTSFLANSCFGSSANSAATGYSFQRKTFYDADNSVFWQLFHDGDEIEIKSKGSGTLPEPIAEWSINEGTGSTAYDSVGSYHASLINTTWTSGVYGSGLDFNGSSSRGIIPQSLPGLGSTFTISGWVNYDTISNYGAIISRYEWGNVDWIVGTNGSVLDCAISYTGSESDRVFATGPSSLTTNVWHHFACVKTSTALTLYMDGVAGTPVSTTGTVSHQSSISPVIGDRANNGYYPLDGTVDNIRIYNTGLSSGQVVQDMTTGNRTTGENWTTRPRLPYDTNDFSVWNQNIGSTEYVFLAITSGYDILLRRGVLSSSGVTWDTEANKVALDGSTASDAFSLPYITLDSSGYIWVSARYFDGANYVIKAAKSTAAANTTWSSLSFGTAVQVSSNQTDPNVYANLASLGNNDMYLTFVENTTLGGCKWNNTASQWQDSTGSLCNSTAAVSRSATPAVVDNASNFGVNADGNHRPLIQNSRGNLYAFLRHSGSCEIWKSADGSSWTEQDAGNHLSCPNSDTYTFDLDSNDVAHLVYHDGATVYYRQFSTVTDTYGVGSTFVNSASIYYIDMALDAYNTPHIVLSDSQTNLKYLNRVGDTFPATGVTVQSGGGTLYYYLPRIIIDKNNLPVVAVYRTPDASVFDLSAFLGNSRLATSFTAKLVDSTISNGIIFSLKEDSQGNIWIAYNDETGTTDYLSLVKHKYSDAWSTWQTPFNNGTYATSVSIFPDNNTLLIYYINGNADVAIASYDTNTQTNIVNIGTLYAGTYTKVFARAGRFRLYNPEYVDSFYSDGTDLTWASVKSNPAYIDSSSTYGANPGSGRKIVRDSKGRLFTSYTNGSNVIIRYSSDGLSWGSVTGPATSVTDSDPALAIDSSNVLHIFYPSNYLYYYTYNTSTGTTTAPTSISPISTSYSPGDYDIAVDSSDNPHVVYSLFDDTTYTLYYRDKTTSSWNTAVSVASGTAGWYVSPSLALGLDNIPQVIYIRGTALTFEVGNAVKATSFSATSLDTVNSVSGTYGASISVGTSGQTYVAYVGENGASDYITLRQHLPGAAWSSWETATTDSRVGSEPSLATVGNSAYVFYIDANSDIAYDVYTGSSWSGETVLSAGTYTDLHLRDSTLNSNFSADTLDFLVTSNATTHYFGRLPLRDLPNPIDPATVISGQPRIFRDSLGHLYLAGQDNSKSCQLWKSLDNGLSWASIFTFGTTIDSCAYAQNSDGNIAALFADSYGVVHYRLFSITTNTDILSENIIDYYPDVAHTGDLAFDSNDKPHALILHDLIESPNSTTYLEYWHKTGSNWTQNQTLDTYFCNGTENCNYFTQISLQINEDNQPEVAYYDPAGTIKLAVGNGNIPTSFATHTLSSVGTSLKSINLDSSGNTYILSQGTTTAYITKHNDADAWTTWQSSLAYTSTNSSLYTAGDSLYLFFIRNSNAFVTIYSNSTWSQETPVESSVTDIIAKPNSFISFASDGQDYGHAANIPEIDYLFTDGAIRYFNSYNLRSDLTRDVIDQSVPDGFDRNLSLLSDTSNNLHLIYADNESTDQVSYKAMLGGTWPSSPAQLDQSDTDTSLSLSVNSTTGNPYAFWIDTADNYVYYRTCNLSAASAACGVGGDWGAKTTFRSTGINRYLNTSAIEPSQVFTQMSVGGGAPVTVFWDKISSGGPNTAPNPPQTPYVNNTSARTGQTTPVFGLTDHTPAFSAIFDDPDAGDTASSYQIQVNSASDFNGTSLWDSNQTSMAACSENSRCNDITYNGSPLVDGNTYYWHIRFWDNADIGSSWSDVQQFSLNNMPVITNITLNGGSDVEIIENESVGVSWIGTATDADGRSDMTTFSGKLFRSGVASGENCSPDNNNCYNASTCTTTPVTANSYTVICSADVYFFAEPTDADSSYSSEYWLARIQAIDTRTEIGSTLSPANNVDLLSSFGLDVGSTLVYGELMAGQNTGNTNRSVVLVNTGNRNIDSEIKGNHLCADGPCSNYISADAQQFGLSGFTYGAGTTLTTGYQTVNVGLTKPTQSPSNSTRNVYWGISIPTGKTAGTYSGAIEIYAVIN